MPISIGRGSARARRRHASRQRLRQAAHGARMNRDRLPVFDRRRAGVLLHVGSLEAALGRGGRAFIDWLAAAGFTVWQILPARPDRRRRLALLGALGLRRQPRLPRPGRAAPTSHARHRRGFPRRLQRLARGLRAVRGAEPVPTAGRLGGAGRCRCATASRGRWSRRAARSAPRSSASSASSSPSACSGSGCASMPTSAACGCSVTCRSTSRPSSVETWAHRELFQLDAGGRADRRGRGAAGLLLGARPAVGQSALRLAGAACARTSPGATRVRVQTRSDSTCCASITSARSPRTGRCRPALPMRAAAPG